jgi:hypothetical protein
VADLDVLHELVLVFQACRMQELQVMEASTQISKEMLGGQAMCSRVGIPVGNPEKSDV